MQRNLFLLIVLFVFAIVANASEISTFTIPYGVQANNEGSVVVNMDVVGPNHNISKSFYGADSYGFSPLPDSTFVSPLNLGYVKLGGSLHSMYNWKLNAYYDGGDNEIFYVYSPLELRLKFIQQEYKAMAMFQINMLGWQPDLNDKGELSVMETANYQHAADAITFINGTKKIGLTHIVMGNEPFESMEVHKKEIPSADAYIEKYIKYAVAVRSAQEKISGNSNDIKLWGPEIATGWTGWQTTHPDDCVFDGKVPEKMKCLYGEGRFTEFMPYFLYKIAQFEKDTKKNPKKYKMLDYISFHYYPLFRRDFSDPGSIILNPDGTQNVSGMLESVNLWDNENYINKYDYASPRSVSPNIIKKFQNWRKMFYPNAKIALTEFAVDSASNIDYHPIVRPLYLADLMARVGSAGVDTFVNSFLQNGSNGDTWAMINGTEKSRLYHIYSLFSNLYIGTALKGNDSFGEKVNSYSVKTKTGINIFIVNKDQADHTTNIRFKRGEDIKTITEINLPKWSLSVLSVPNDRGQKIKVYQYGAKEMGIE